MKRKAESAKDQRITVKENKIIPDLDRDIFLYYMMKEYKKMLKLGRFINPSYTKKSFKKFNYKHILNYGELNE